MQREGLAGTNDIGVEGGLGEGGRGGVVAGQKSGCGRGVPGRIGGYTRRGGVARSYPEVCRAQSNTTPAPRTASAPSTLQPWRDEKITRRERERRRERQQRDENGSDLGGRPTEGKAGGEQRGAAGARGDVEVVKKKNQEKRDWHSL